MEFMESVNTIKEAILQAKSIGLCGHVKPDGDCLGSSLSLYKGIKQINNNVSIIKNDKVPDYLHILKNTEDMTDYNPDLSYDLFIVLDSSSIDRIGDCQSLFNKANKTICIDHHRSNTFFADINLVDGEKSSTCELVYELITAMDLKYDIDMSNNTFIGLLTDTNRFMYTSTTGRTLEIASDLMNNGIDKDAIMQALYQSNSLISYKLTGIVIENAKFLYDNKLSICPLTTSDLDSIGATRDDIEDKINLIRDIDTVEVACLIKQEGPDQFDISFRSKNHVDVSKIALSLGGGGHLRAAGCSYTGSLDSLLDELMERFEKIEWSKI